jgi:hypothetical protein
MWPTDAVQAASATYDGLIQFLDSHPSLRKRPAEPWSKLQELVSQFADAKTRTAKQEWFGRNGFTDSTFLSEVSLDPGDHPSPTQQRVGRLIIPKVDFDVPPQLKDFLRRLFDRLLQTSSSPKAFLESFVDSKTVAKNLGFTAEFGDPTTICSTLFYMWRIRDHGIVSSLGHGDPLAGSEAFRRLAQVASQGSTRVEYDSLASAVLLETPDSLPAIVFPATERDPQLRGGFIVTTVFTHAPSDEVIMVVMPADTSYRVVSLTWNVDERPTLSNTLAATPELSPGLRR